MIVRAADGAGWASAARWQCVAVVGAGAAGGGCSGSRRVGFLADFAAVSWLHPYLAAVCSLFCLSGVGIVDRRVRFKWSRGARPVVPEHSSR